MTSALPREGKTTAAVNLAVTLAQLGDKTLLVDGDLRKPGVSRALNLADGKHAGLSSYLAGVSTLDLVTVPHPSISNLHVIPTGPIPPNPADLLSSHRLAEMVAELRKRYKFIVIDSPPIMAATDAVILSVLVDGVLLVVRSGETPKEAFTRTRDLLASVKSRMLGVVLNAVDSSSPDYYYSYRYYPYSYGAYGREERDKSTSKSGGNGNGSSDWSSASKAVRTSEFHEGSFMRALITGGAGFIGSHLAERLLERGDEVLLMDNLSTGSMENIRHLKQYDRMHYFLEPIENRQLLAELVDEADVVFHLAAAVGVRLIVESPVRTIETNVNGTQLVLEAACKKRKLVFIGFDLRSLREEPERALSRRRRPGAGADDQGPLELCRVEGPRRIPGAFLLEGEAAAGDRRSALQHRGAAADRPVRHGASEFRLAGAQGRSHHRLWHGQAVPLLLRCDGCVEAILRLVETGAAVGEVVNIGTDHEVTIEGLAQMVKERTGSASSITHIRYEEAYEPGFEDMYRRVPSLAKLERLTGFRPTMPLNDIVDRVVTYFRRQEARSRCRYRGCNGGWGYEVAF